jgi:DNA polymerase-3 subunit delta
MASVKKKTKNPLIYVICGSQPYLVSSAFEKTIDSLIEPDQKQLCLYQPENAEKARIQDVLDELRTVPFLADRRVVALKDADKFISANRSVLEDYFDEPSKNGVLVMTVKSWPKNTRLAKKLPAHGRLIEIKDIKPARLADFIVSYARDNWQKNIDRRTAAVLVDLTGDDVGKCCSEVDKLAMYIGKRTKITLCDIEVCVGNNRIFDAFSVIDAISLDDCSAAVERLRNMFAADKSAEYTSVGAFAYHFRRLFEARAMFDKNIGARQKLSKLRVWYNKEGFLRQMKKMPLDRIAAVLLRLGQIDYQLKTGKASADTAIEKLAVQLSL